MKHLKLLLLICITGSIGVFLFLHVILNLFGASLLSAKLTKLFNHKVTIGKFTTVFPVGFNIKDIKAEGLFSVDEVAASGGLLSILPGGFQFSSLKMVRPVVTIEKDKKAPPVVPADNLAGQSQVSSGLEETPKFHFSDILGGNKIPSWPDLRIKQLIISDGVVNLVDKTVSDSGIVVKVEKLNLKMNNLSLPGRASEVTDFDLKGSMPWRQGEDIGKLTFNGQANLFKKDIRAMLSVEDIDGVYLYPYYSQWIDLGKARIEQAKLDFKSDIEGANNNLVAKCRLELTDIVRTPRQPNEPEQKEQKITDVVLDMLKEMDQGKVVVNFNIRTKLDKPKVSLNNIKTAVEKKVMLARNNSAIKMRDIANVPQDFLFGVVKSVTDLSRAMMDGVFAIGGGIKKAADESFDKEEVDFSLETG